LEHLIRFRALTEDLKSLYDIRTAIREAHVSPIGKKRGIDLPPDLSAEELMERACECLASCDSEGALFIAERLEKMRYSGAFEIRALAFASENKLEKAIKCLERGVKLCPQVWILWELLGNYRSDAGQFNKAMLCYDKAASCPDVDANSINYNRATCLSRQDRNEEALAVIATVDSEEKRIPKGILQTRLLVAAKRYEKAITVAQKLVGELEAKEFSPENQRQQSTLNGQLSRAYLEFSQDQVKARSAVEIALMQDKTNESALAVLRELNNMVAGGEDRLISAIVQGIWDQPFEGGKSCPGFFASYHVVASSPDEALKFIRPLERSSVRGSLAIYEHRSQKRKSWQGLKGVYTAVGGYIFFSEE
jgi:tetratricopeptide (TPR) repeat protein